MNKVMDATRHPQRADRGFTLVELVIVLALLGILSAVVVGTVFDFRGEADANTCAADARALQTAVEAYKAQRGVTDVPATGAGLDRYEMTLVEDGFIRAVSTLHDVDADGELMPADGSPCTLD